MARPATKEKLQKFLGCINFYHRFVPHLVAILAPLHGLTSSAYGVQSDLVSDQGCQFVSALWRHLMVTLGISASSTTVYHPQLNGMVKRFHRTLKERLMARQAGTDWMDPLSPVLMGLRLLRENSLTSPHTLSSAPRSGSRVPCLNCIQWCLQIWTSSCVLCALVWPPCHLIPSSTMPRRLDLCLGV